MVLIIARYGMSETTIEVPLNTKQSHVVESIAQAYALKPKHVKILFGVNFLTEPNTSLEAIIRKTTKRVVARVFLSNEYILAEQHIRRIADEINELAYEIRSLRDSHIFSRDDPKHQASLKRASETATQILLRLDSIDVSGGLKSLRKIQVTRALYVANQADKLIEDLNASKQK